MRILIFSFLFTLTLFSAVKDKEGRVVSEVIFPKSRPVASIPLQSGRGLVFTNAVQINGIAAGVFIIDTGSNVSVIDKSLLVDLGLNETFQSLDDVSDLRKFRFNRVENLQIGRLKIKNHYLYAGNVIKNYPKFDKEVVGIIGGDILGKMPFKLDLNNFTLSFYQKEAFKPTGNETALKVENRLKNLAFFSEANPHAGVPVISTKINDDIYEELMIDTAVNDDIILRSGAAVRNQKLKGSFKVPIVIRKPGSSLLQYNATIKKAEFGGLSYENKGDFSYILFPREGFVEEQSQLGAKCLKNTVIYADYAKGKIWFNKGTTPAKLRGDLDFANHNSLARAVMNGNEAAVKKLLQQKEQLNFKGLKGETLLMLAVEGKNSNVLELILKKFPLLVNTYNHAGVTAFMRAAAASEVFMIDSLISHGAQMERADVDGMNALHYSILGGSLVVLDKLIRKKLDIDRPMKNGMTALSLAAGEGNKQLFDALLEANAKVSFLDKLGRTMVHMATFGNNPDILAKVIEHKDSPDINMPSKDGMTPLMVAVKHQKMNSVKVLLKFKASVKAMNSKNFTTALDLAIQSKNDELVEMIQDAWGE
ncbi:MAG: ankyrin repeat domain-containing protein [Lentisphaeraceae bacterium]|nr:ankyrin repeat domain-containing protein [Lentisphaeraceae bacterium]